MPDPSGSHEASRSADAFSVRRIGGGGSNGWGGPYGGGADGSLWPHARARKAPPARARRQRSLGEAITMGGSTMREWSMGETTQGRPRHTSECSDLGFADPASAHFLQRTGRRALSQVVEVAW